MEKKTVKAQAVEIKAQAVKVITMLSSNKMNVALANNVVSKLEAAAKVAKAATLQKAYITAADKVAKAAAAKEAEIKATMQAAADELNRRKEAAAKAAADELNRRRENLAACTAAAVEADKEAAAAADKAAAERKAAAAKAAAAKAAAVNLAYSRTLHGLANDEDAALVGLDAAANNAAAVVDMAAETLANLRKDKAFKAVHDENKSLSHALKDMLHTWDKYAAVLNAANCSVKKDELTPKLFAAEAVNPFLLVATAKGIKVGLLGRTKVTAVTAWNAEKALLVLVANSVLNHICAADKAAAAAKEAQYSLILNAATALQAAAAAKVNAKAANSKAAAKAAAVGKANDITSFEAAADKANKAAAAKAAANKVAADKAAAAKEAAAAANKAQTAANKAAAKAAKEAAKAIA